MMSNKWVMLMFRALHDIVIACGILFIMILAGVV